MIKNKLKSIRHKCEMNQKQFAAFIEINYRQYNGYEKQKVQPSIEVAFEICEILNKKLSLVISLNDIFEYIKDDPEI